MKTSLAGILRTATLVLAGLLVNAGAARAGQSAVAASSSSPELIPVNAKQVLDVVRQPGASATLVNVWATWCVPCREEFPDLMRVYRELQPQGLRLVLVSADFDDDRKVTVKKYLKSQGVDFSSYLKEQQDQEFIDQLSPEWTGALPVTLFYDKDGALQDVWEGASSYKSLLKKAKSVLGSKTRPKEAK